MMSRTVKSSMPQACITLRLSNQYIFRGYFKNKNINYFSAGHEYFGTQSATRPADPQILGTQSATRPADPQIFRTQSATRPADPQIFGTHICINKLFFNQYLGVLEAIES